MFANYKNGEIRINSFRLIDAVATTQENIIEAYKAQSEEILTAIVTNEAELERYIEN